MVVSTSRSTLPGTSTSTSTSVFAPRRTVPAYDTQYIRSLNWPSLGPHTPLAPPRGRGVPPQVPVPAPALVPAPAGRSARIAFGLRRRIERKEGVPLSFLLQEDVGTLKRLVVRPYERVLPRSSSECGARAITLRFWVSLKLTYPTRWLGRERLPGACRACGIYSRPCIRTLCRSTRCPSWTLAAATWI